VKQREHAIGISTYRSSGSQTEEAQRLLSLLMSDLPIHCSSLASWSYSPANFSLQ